MSSLLIKNARIIPLDGRGIIEQGYILMEKGKIMILQEGTINNREAEEIIDAKGMVVMPSLTDCHTHLMEYATAEVHKTRGKGQRMAGIANLLTALKAGISHLGEHHLGHPVLTQEIEDYRNLIRDLPIKVKLSFGCCFLGTESLSLVSATRPGQVLQKEDLTRREYSHMAANSDFAGENLFLNATVANLPLEAVPRAGEVTYNDEELAEIIELFHAGGKKVGAHIEGDEGVRMFLEAGGDVIHHGHNIKESTMDLIAKKGTPLVVTPHGGTAAVPTSPVEALSLYSKGIKFALASDSYLPVHPGAVWISLPPGQLVGPQDFLTICHPIMNHFLQNGIPLEEVLALITINGREILTSGTETGILAGGQKADLIVCDSIPGIESIDSQCVKCVIIDGEIVYSQI